MRNTEMKGNEKEKRGEKIKRFFKNHKEEIILCSSMVLSFVGGLAIGKMSKKGIVLDEPMDVDVDWDTAYNDDADDQKCDVYAMYHIRRKDDGTNLFNLAVEHDEEDALEFIDGLKEAIDERRKLLGK